MEEFNDFKKQDMLFRRMEGSTLKDIGDIYEVSPERVRSILAVEIRKMKRSHYRYIEERAAMVSVIKKLKDENNYLLRTTPQEIYKPRQTDNKCVLNLKISDLDLSVRSKNALRNSNINTIGDLIKIKKSELIRTPNFGRKSMIEIECALKELGAYILDD